MKFDIFLSICQTEVDGYMPSEKKMFQNFFEQVRFADELGFGTAWVAETHLSCQIQKENPGSVIPHFKGEIGLNTDILQVAHKVFGQTRHLNVGSAIRNILCNGGPIAHAEAIRTFLTLHSVDESEKRLLEIGFAAGRFPFSNTPYGVRPRNETEKVAWDVVKNKWFQSATEIFVRFIKGDKFSSQEVSPRYLQASDFREEALWQKTQAAYAAETGQKAGDKIPLNPFYEFDRVGVIPFEAPLKNLRLTIGSHDPEAQILANQFYPTGVFNLSITPPAVIEEAHKRMRENFHSGGGTWQRDMMPRTCLVFIDENHEKAKTQAHKAWENYWRAMEKTLDPKKVEQAVGNATFGTPEEVLAQMKEKYHKDDRLLLWFDFNNHDSNAVKNSMKLFMEKVAPHLA
ncbi:MAG: LLM class flavin-dependent oxidoreductase [Pseudobdellovibrionaceae bacterium]